MHIAFNIYWQVTSSPQFELLIFIGKIEFSIEIMNQNFEIFARELGGFLMEMSGE